MAVVDVSTIKVDATDSVVRLDIIVSYCIAGEVSVITVLFALPAVSELLALLILHPND